MIQSLQIVQNKSRHQQQSKSIKMQPKQQITKSGIEQSGMVNFFNVLSNNLNNSINDVVNDIVENVIKSESVEKEYGDQVKKDQNKEIEEQDGIPEVNLNKISLIRQKQMQLLEELKRLKQQEQQLLRKNNIKNQKDLQNGSVDQNKIFQQGSQNRNSSPKNQQQEQQYNFFYEPIISTTQNLSPIRPKRRKYIKPKIVMPDPVVPEFSRSQFEKRVKEIAGSIRSKIHKQNPSQIKQKKNLTKSVSRQKYKIQKYMIKLPDIQPRKISQRTKINSNTMLEYTEKQNNQSNDKSEDKTKNIQKAMRSIIQEIINISFQKIRYKEKYGLKLDPIHHKYPMTSFRKRVIQEKYHKQKQKYISMTESLRNSMLNQRKIIQKQFKNK